MQIQKNSSGDLLEIVVEGVLDNDSSVYFRSEIEASAREGWHRILVDLSGVTYLSSAGISALIASKQQLDRLNGLFGVHSAGPQVEQVLRLTRLLETLQCDPELARSSGSAGTMTVALSPTTRIAGTAGLSLEIYTLGKADPLSCRTIGNPRSLYDSKDTVATCRKVTCGLQSFSIGLGSLGEKADSSKLKFGEIITVAGAVAQSPQRNGGLPDYSLAAGDFLPAAQFLYGVECEGDFPTLIRFEGGDSGEPVALSALVSAALKETKFQVAAIVILADSAGLVGAQLRQLPAQSHDAGVNSYAVPGVRDWLSFSAERIHRRNLVLVAGIAAAGPLDESSPLHPLLRPMDAAGTLSGHFHAAVFPYQPLKKRTLQLQTSVANLFEGGAIQDVLHLLRDDRPITGSGESELVSGACWLGPIEEVPVMEDNT